MPNRFPESFRLSLRRWLPLLLFGVVIFAGYWPCLNGGLVWDDGEWITRREHLHRDLSGLWRMWSDPTALQQYFPVTGTTFWLDWNLWGEWTLPYHVENILLHALAALMFAHLLRRLRVPGAALAAAIFALHPMMVESVAWITERKNVLSLVLSLGSLIAYGRWASYWDASGESRRRMSQWWFSLLLFILALLAKITAFCLPPAILLIAWWRRGRLRWKEDVAPVLHFFIVAFLLGLLVTWVEVHHVGAEGEDFAMSFTERCLLAGSIFWFYAAKLLWPLDLCLFYPKWEVSAASPLQWLLLAAALALPAGLWLARRNPAARAACVSVMRYLTALFPLLGFFNVYGMLFAHVADRWAYVPSMSLIALVSAGVTLGLRRAGWPRFTAWPVLVVLAVLTHRHAANYRDWQTYWSAALRGNPESWHALNNLGGIYAEQGKHEEALRYLNRALEIRPRCAEAHHNKGNVLRGRGQVDAAIDCYGEGLAIEHRYPDAHNNLGMALAMAGRLEEAETHFRKAIENQSSLHFAHNNLGNVLFARGNLEAAAESYNNAIQRQPGYADAHSNLGMVRLEQGKSGEAVSHLQRAVELRPGYAEAHHNLALTLAGLGRFSEAIGHYERAVEAAPQQLGSVINLAWLLATSPDDDLRNGSRAVELAESANALTQGSHPLVLRSLAAAYAEAGRHAEAANAARRALNLATAGGNTELSRELGEQLTAYESGRAFRIPRPTP